MQAIKQLMTRWSDCAPPHSTPALLSWNCCDSMFQPRHPFWKSTHGVQHVHR